MKKIVFILTLLMAYIGNAWGQATLPLSRTTWDTTEPTGWTNSGCTARTSTSACSGSNATIFDATGDSRTVNFASTPDRLVFKLKKQSMSGESKIVVEESSDATSWTIIGNYGTATGATTITDCGDITIILSSTSRYVKWTYIKATGNCDMDDVSITSGASATPTVGFTAATSSQTETDATFNVSIPVTMSNYGGSQVDLSVAVTGGTAEAGDYALNTATLSFTADGTQNISMDINDDADMDSETIQLTITETTATGATISTSVHTVTVTDDDIPNIVIYEVYGGGGNSGATYTHDYVVLYNNESTDQSLDGWSIQYASAPGTSWTVNALTGTISANNYYLIQLATSGPNGLALPITPNATGNSNMGVTAGKVALASSTTAFSGTSPSGSTLVDFVGYGTTANAYEGTAPAPVPSSTTAIRRNGGTDTDDNSVDFLVYAPLPLPVELTSFTAKAIATGVELGWSTAWEENNRYFAVERGTDGVAFATIGEVAGAGNSTEPQHYRFVDAQPFAGVNYYRLRQVDFDGGFEYHKVVAVTVRGGKAIAWVLPTQVNEQFEIALSEAFEGTVGMEIYTANGQLVQSEQLTVAGNRHAVAAAHLQAGVYIAKLNLNGEVITTRFVKL